MIHHSTAQHSTVQHSTAQYSEPFPRAAVQVRECAAALLQAAKRTGIPVFIVGHVTKAGEIAGPRVLEHIVDVVLYMEVRCRGCTTLVTRQAVVGG